MTPIASAAARASIMASAGFVLFILASYAVYPGHPIDKLRVFGAFTDPTSYATLGLAWLVALALHFLPAGAPSRRQPVRIAQAVFVTLMASAAIVAAYQGMTAAFRGTFVPWQFALRYQIRLLEAAIFAVAVIRMSLPILPRFARVQPRNP